MNTLIFIGTIWDNPSVFGVPLGIVCFVFCCIAILKNQQLKGNSRETPLHTAAWKGQKEVAEKLIDAGADVNATTATLGETPLDLAIRWERPEVADLLRKRGGKQLRE